MNTWLMLRAAGIASYLMLFATVAWGLIGTTSVVGRRVSRATAVAIHQFMSTVAFLFLGVHLAGLLLDRFVPFTVLDLLIPLRASFKPWATALGILAMYTVVIVLVSSWVRKGIGTKWWRRLHLLAVPAFGMAMVHGAFAGTDTVRPWMWITYLVTGGLVVFLMLLRALTVGLRARAAHKPRTGANAASAGATDPARAARIAEARAKSAAMRAAKAAQVPRPAETPVTTREPAETPVTTREPAEPIRVELMIHVSQDGSLLVGGAPVSGGEHVLAEVMAALPPNLRETGGTRMASANGHASPRAEGRSRAPAQEPDREDQPGDGDGSDAIQER